VPDAVHMLPRSASFSGCIPVRFDGAPYGPMAGMALWRGVKDFEHGTLCRAFGLDPVRFYFDLPSSVRGVGMNNRGFDAGHGRRRIVNGYVMMSGVEVPVGKLTVISDSDRFKDVDPSSVKEFYDLSHS
jgi:hypothetical protein